MGVSDRENSSRGPQMASRFLGLSRDPQGVRIQSLTVSPRTDWLHPNSCVSLKTQDEGENGSSSLDSSLDTKRGQKVRGFTQMPLRKDPRGTRAGQASRVWKLLRASVPT